MQTAKTSKVSRKNFFKLSLGAAGGVIAGNSLGQTCTTSPTADQPLGPFFPNEGTPQIPVDESPDSNLPISERNDNDLTLVKNRNGRVARGQVVWVKGKITDSQCQPVEGARIVIWQASKSGHYNHTGDNQNKQFRDPRNGTTITRELDPNFQYWGRAISDAQGNYIFKTIVPGYYPADIRGGWYRPPHIHFLISATGYQQKTTQMYFSGSILKDVEWIKKLNQDDLLLQTSNISDEERAKLVIEFSTAANEAVPSGTFDITLER